MTTPRAAPRLRQPTAFSPAPTRREPVIGLVVNPVAGIGGPAGLAGSDGVDVQSLAAARGSAARAGERAALALSSLPPSTEVLTAAGAMGEDAATAAHLRPRVVYIPASGATADTTAADSTAAVRALAAAGATLVLFAGGDGTARDVSAALADIPHVAALASPRASRCTPLSSR